MIPVLLLAQVLYWIFDMPETFSFRALRLWCTIKLLIFFDILSDCWRLSLLWNDRTDWFLSHLRAGIIRIHRVDWSCAARLLAAYSYLNWRWGWFRIRLIVWDDTRFLKILLILIHKFMFGTLSKNWSRWQLDWNFIISCTETTILIFLLASLLCSGHSLDTLQHFDLRYRWAKAAAALDHKRLIAGDAQGIQ